MSDPLGFYLISDFHVDLNNVLDPKDVGGAILHDEHRRGRVVKQIHNWLPIPKDRIVAFVGDTANSAEVAALVWKEAAERVRDVLVVTGNHEYYYPRWRTVLETEARVRADLTGFPSIQFLEALGKTFLHRGVLFLGCTGWYNWDACPEYDRGEEMNFWKGGSNDARMIQYDCGYPDLMARRNTDWLLDEVARAQDRDEVEQIVILTHTCPRPEFLVPPDHPWYRLNGSYANSFMLEVPPVDVKKKIKVWAYGHSHYRRDDIIDGIRYVNHARGYAGESQPGRVGSIGWKPRWIGLDLTPVAPPYTPPASSGKE
jgi:predicted phosphodiesterase